MGFPALHQPVERLEGQLHLMLALILREAAVVVEVLEVLVARVAQVLHSMEVLAELVLLQPVEVEVEVVELLV